MVENVLLVTIDSLRYDTWQTMKPSLSAAPRLESRGIDFSRAFATGPGTTTSFPGMLTGTLPLSYGGLGPLDDARPRVAVELGDRGLATGGFHSNPFLSSHFHYDVGFEAFEDYQNPLMGVATKIFPRGIEINNPKIQRLDDLVNFTGLLKSGYRAVSGKSRPYVSAEVITDDTIAWLSETRTPFFGWAHYMDVHHPCFPPRADRAAFGVEHVDNATVSEWYSSLIRNPDALSEDDIDDMLALYRAAIRYVDRQVERLLDALERNGLLEDTLVVLTSDHGELFGEYGKYGKPERMYDELLHVPLVVLNAPESVADAADELVSLLDLPPLFHEALGLDVPESYEGRAPGVGSRAYVVAEHEVGGNPIVGVRSDDWLYEADEIAGERRLFEVDSMRRVDPSSVTDRAVARLEDAAEARLRSHKLDVGESVDEELTADVEARLEDLGYR
ncbi:sulfatase [Halogeometricum limi]|uniref:Arylsulfatase A n=1 Tax=Halogeometricum limi TaxID=555875 RepID=A0A1I6IJT0_9EURY|nr:sulfatase [Halogeometricum limi]SFR66941.1 Arylsulfatase A [Halogeometricum limi]